MLDNLDRLKAFFHVYSLGSVVEAAEVLHVTQPAVSQAIQKLEAEVKSPLFIRQHKQLIPTSAGQRLFDVVQPFMDNLDSCLESLAYAKDHPYGELRIGAPTQFGKAYLPAILAEFRQQYPDVTFTLEFGLFETLVEDVRQGAIDLALVDLFLVDRHLIENPVLFHFEPVFEESVVLACSPGYYEKHIHGKPTLEMLTKLDFIEYTRKARTIAHWFKHHFNAPKANYRTVLTIDEHDAVVSAIKHGAGLGVVAPHLVEEELRNKEIVPVLTDKRGVVNQIALLHLQDKVPTLTDKLFRAFLVERIEQIGSQCVEI
ncbi:LysR family transcriptional regulator [Pseudodesulfovibrio sp. zrk46]|uniref:LysR family transcriptional regulator n=1 Tax=Pseudodesulfovibrio sp. zrk46 TaxID=2725288 RepID=UPI0014498B4C|nr:LysR family transcriptional regulator [Pseudodesulfovibrio sp. zrk46]QJB55711.1 LysR family transcriptional regulator [Pseudodesulfovibrio sp. zrk46]